MIIKGTSTVAEYKAEQQRHIEKWIDDNFVEGSVVWEMSGANAIKVTDTKGDTMTVSLDDID